MHILKEILYLLLVRSGMARLAVWLNRRKILVLAYHDVYTGPPDPVLNFDGIRVRVDQFERQMRYLKAHYHVVPLEEILQPRTSRLRQKPLAAVTFDDGYRTLYRHAFPVLRRLGIPASVFVFTDFVLHERRPWWERLRAMVAATRCSSVVVHLHGGERSLRLVTARDKKVALQQMVREVHALSPEHREAFLRKFAADLAVNEGELATGAPLTVGEIREMVEGGISVQSHGCSHDSFLHLSKERLLAELTESKRLLEWVTSRPVTWHAYPYGEFSRQAIDAAIVSGYRGAVTTVEGLNDGIADPYAVQRMDIHNDLSFARFVVVVSGLRDLLKSVLRFGRPETAPGAPHSMEEVPG